MKSKRFWKRVRRARRRGKLTPAEALEISSRARNARGWIATKSITRRHRYPKNWYFQNL